LWHVRLLLFLPITVTRGMCTPAGSTRPIAVHITPSEANAAAMPSYTLVLFTGLSVLM
jgi:hypothetical protein